VSRRGGGGSGPKVALLVASGTIAPGKSDISPYSGSLVGSETMMEALRDIREDETIEGLVLRIDSPGGSVQASDEILAELLLCREEMPIVVTMSDLAASGGYYIAMAADSIVAHPTTQTGSIGIYGGKLNVRGLYEKLGLSIELFTRGENATLLSPYADWNEAQRQMYLDQLQAHYRMFLEYVAANRDFTTEAVDSLARGRVWTGRAALGNGLVDANGGFDRAFDMIRSLAGYDEETTLQIESFPRVERSWLAELLTEMLSEEESSVRMMHWPRLAQAWFAASQWPEGVPIALMPWVIEAR
jgi:protease-4